MQAGGGRDEGLDTCVCIVINASSILTQFWLRFNQSRASIRYQGLIDGSIILNLVARGAYLLRR